MKKTLLASVLMVSAAAQAAPPAAITANNGAATSTTDVTQTPEMPALDDAGNMPTLQHKGKKAKADLRQELRVVQDRPFTFRNKIEGGVFFGGVFTDPFLAANNYGAMLSYHFHDYFSLGVVAWLYSSGPSQALTLLRNEAGANANTNPIHNFYGGEATFSPIFGKLTLIGRLIVYLDLHLMAGAGKISTDTGSYFAPFGGIGGSYIIAKRFALRVDYRLMYYSEMLLQQNSTVANYGKLFGPRDNFTDLVSLGVSILL